MDKNSKQNLRYLYRVYGMNIESDIEIKEFIKVHEFNDKSIVKINKCKLEWEIKDKISDGICSMFSKNEIWFNVRNIAIYQMLNGNTINFEVYENADMDVVQLYLTYSCLGFIMIQREKIALHGGTVIIDGKAIIITGERGAGKSTLTTALRESGFKFLSDDVAAISECEPLKVQHGFPYEKLCADAMNKFNYDKKNYKSFMGDEQIKYLVPAIDDFCLNDVPLACVIELEQRDIATVQIEEVKGIEKLNNIIKSIYRGEYLDYIQGISANYMKKCISISKDIKYYKIIRPKNEFTVYDQIELVESVVKEA